MRYQDGKAYRGKVYVLAELPGLIENICCHKFGTARVNTAQNDILKRKCGMMRLSKNTL